jgi:hypothetical protein
MSATPVAVPFDVGRPGLVLGFVQHEPDLVAAQATDPGLLA